MITFYDINEGKEFKAELEFKTRRKLDPFKILSDDTFIIALKDNQFDLYFDNSIFRFTPEFRFKLEKHNQDEYKEILLFSADAVYFELLKEFLKLEPCFKFKPPESLTTEEIKKIISASTCAHGFLEINCFADTITLDILLLSTGKEIEKIEITEINRINRILIYDTEKNLSCGLTKNPIKIEIPKNSIIRKDSFGGEENLQTKLFKLIADYFEKNISAKTIWDIPLDRDAIFREHATPETLEKTFTAIKKAIEKIKLNQKEHKEKIKELISIFYSENYDELEKLNLTTTIEKLYAQL